MTNHQAFETPPEMAAFQLASANPCVEDTTSTTACQEECENLVSAFLLPVQKWFGNAIQRLTQKGKRHGLPTVLFLQARQGAPDDPAPPAVSHMDYIFHAPLCR